MKTLLKLQLLAQANAAPPVEPTSGQMLSGLIVLFVMAASIWMIVVWFGRLGQTGHALPAARRGILRVPLVLTFVTIGLSLLMIVLMIIMAMQDQLAPQAAGSAPGAVAQAETDQQAAAEPSAETSTKSEGTEPTSVVQDGSGEIGSGEIGTETGAETTDAAQSSSDQGVSEVAAGPDADKSQAAPAGRQMNADDMKTALIQLLEMDLFLLLILGTVVLISSSNGRVPLSDNARQLVASNPSSFETLPFATSNSMWPDLNASNGTTEMHGLSGIADRSITTSPDSSPFTELSPYAAPPMFENALPSPGFFSGPEPEEQFSFLTELRYASEVFLAAYVPTAVLRILIVMLTVGLTGEDPGQHPFLEMLDAGVSVTVIGLILVTAVVFAPVVEELQFRVIILGGIAQFGRPFLAITLSSILFAFAHGFPDSLALLPLAFALGYTYLRRRSYITVMLVHFLFNGFNMILALLALL